MTKFDSQSKQAFDTIIQRIEPSVFSAEMFSDAINLLNQGELVAFPTETVYGLGARWDIPSAVHDIFSVKGRPQDNPLIVHESSVARMKRYFKNWDAVADVLANAFCPGPFTLIMEHRDGLSSPVTAGLNTIGLRIPQQAVARALIHYLGEGIAAPSANLSGKPSPTTAAAVWEDLNGRIPLILDGGACEVGLESTIVSWVGGKLELLRPGAVSPEDITVVLKKAGLDVSLQIPSALDVLLAESEAPKAPGMKYRHYAPKASVVIIPGKAGEIDYDELEVLLGGVDSGDFLGFFIEERQYERLVCLLEKLERSYLIRTFAGEAEHGAAARDLFETFRFLDRNAVSAIYVESQRENGVGLAYMNRLRKASSANDGH